MKNSSVFSACAGSLIALLITTGCDNSKSTSTQKPAASPPSNTNTAPPSAIQNPAPTQTTAAPPATLQESKPIVQATPTTPPVAPASPGAASSDEEKREQASNLIYAQIRVKMEEFIEERAKLLKGGTDPADPKVRELEGRIMRARELLTSNGEVVEDVEPPIVQKSTNP